MTAADRDRRERVRLEVAERFAHGESCGQVAATLRVTERSVERWRRANAWFVGLRAPVERAIATIKCWRILHTDYW